MFRLSNLSPCLSRSLTRPFHSSSVLHKFTRLVLPHDVDQTQYKRNRKDVLKEVEAKLDAEKLINEVEFQASRRKARLERKNRSKDMEHPYSAYDFTVTIVGRPNVGKSTLYNRLIGYPGAIVDGSSGVTRDWNSDRGELGGLNFRVIDTAGLEEVDFQVLGAQYSKEEQFKLKQHRHNGQNWHNPFGQALKPEKRSGKGIGNNMRKDTSAVSNRDSKSMTSNFALGRPLLPEQQQHILNLTKDAVENSDLVIFMVDVKAGISPMDEHFAQWVRKLLTPKGPTREEELDEKFSATNRRVLRSIHSKPVMLVANKYDYGGVGEDIDVNMMELYNLGFGDPIPFSSSHGTGVGELHSAMLESMTDVLKQWDQYQKKVLLLKQEHRLQLEGKTKEEIVHLTSQGTVLQVRKEGMLRAASGLRASSLGKKLLGRSTLRPEKKKDADELAEVMKPKGLRVDDEYEGRERVRVVVAGKPNVGKSTLINGLLGEERLLSGPQPGVTRDSITVTWTSPNVDKHVFELVDTAGIKGVTAAAHSKFDRVDSMAMRSTVRSIERANVVILVIDVVDGLYGSQGIDPLFAGQIHKNFVQNINGGEKLNEKDKKMKNREKLGKRSAKYEMEKLTTPRNPEKQAYIDKLSMLVSRVAGAVSKHDLDVARLATEHGKPLIILANKIDMLRNGDAEVRSVLKGLETLFTYNLAQNKGVTVLPVSAQNQNNLQLLPTLIAKLYDKWTNRISTGLLNRWIRALTVIKPPPAVNGKKINLKYATQTNIRPPAFAIFASRKTEFPEDYKKFLENSLKEEFQLDGVPLRLHIRSGDNPYVENRVQGKSEKRKIKIERIRDKIDEKKSHRKTGSKLPSNRIR